MEAPRARRVLAIDPGTTNLGWAYVVGTDIEAAGVDTVWLKQPHIHDTLTKAVVEWFERHRTYFEQADRILIEQQYLAKGSSAIFAPMIVMEVLLTVGTLLWPGKTRLVHAGSLKNHYQIRGTYDERKAQVVRLAGLDHLRGRVHDIADCLLMVEFDKGRDEHTADLAAKMARKVARRAAIAKDALPTPTPRARSVSPPPRRSSSRLSTKQ
jgi:hypothetical protein